MKIIVTGGLGFIGSHFCEHMLERGFEVVSIDNLDPFYDPNLKIANGEHLKKHDRFQSMIFDINNFDLLCQTMADFKPDLIMHAAGKAGVRPSLKNPQSYITANLLGTTNLLEAMTKTGVDKLLFCSSSSVYGERDETQFSEELPFDSSISFYASTKQCGELLTRYYHNLFKVSVINMRFFTVYGPRQRPDLAIHKFLRAAKDNKTITVFGDGSMKRDYTFINDTVQGIGNAGDRLLQAKSPLYETYNLGNSTPVSLVELLAAIEKVTGKTLDIQHEDVPMGDVPLTYANIDKAKANLDYSPKTDLETGLGLFYEWMQNT